MGHLPIGGRCLFYLYKRGNIMTTLLTVAEFNSQDYGLKELVTIYKQTRDPLIKDLINSDERWAEKETVCGSVIFGSIIPPGVLTIERHKYRHPMTPDSNPNYIVNLDVLKAMMAWWCSPMQMLSLFLFGETGTGKTEFVTYFCDKMNCPLVTLQTNESLRCEQLFGGFQLINNETVFNYGGLAAAAKYGWCFLADELDKASGDITSKLHGATDRKPVMIDDTGEVIPLHNNYRFIGTGNTSGNGNTSGRYHTSQSFDEAFKLRFAFVEVPYPEPKVELAILTQFEDITALTKKRMIKFANQMRNSLKDGDFSAAFSTRSLVAWCYYMQTFGAKSVPMKRSFDFAFGNSLNEDDKEVTEGLLTRIFGDDLNHPDK